MKILLIRTALHIAVFLLLIGTGCYTTLRAPTRMQNPSITENEYQRMDWDFGCGWYYHEISGGSDYFYYHSMPWWYNRRPDIQDSSLSSSLAPDQSQSGGGKVIRHDFDVPFQGNAALPFTPSMPQDSSSTIQPSVPADSTIKPNINMTTDTNKDKPETGQDSSSEKVTRRGRR